MLKLELTDGEKKIEGMEYQPMKKLSSDLIPGTKVGSFYYSQILCNSSISYITMQLESCNFL
jgi:hypothetical protein